MKKNYLWVLLGGVIMSGFWSCETEAVEIADDCVYNAVVEDFTGLDGCGYLFKLDNGDYLEPVWTWRCGTPPVSEDAEENPLMGFQFEHGKRVRIGFNETNDFGSICMKGKMVFITCVEELDPPTDTLD